MNGILFSTVWIFGAISFAGSVYGAETAKTDQHSDYVLVWSDEFNRDGRPDPNNWTYEHGFVRNEEYGGISRECPLRRGLLIEAAAAVKIRDMSRGTGPGADRPRAVLGLSENIGASCLEIRPFRDARRIDTRRGCGRRSGRSVWPGLPDAED